MKRGIVILLALISLISFVSAQNIMSDFLNSLDSSIIILGAIFIISFGVIFFALNNSIFKQNNAIAGIVAGAISFLIVYGVNKTGFDFSGFFVDIGIPQNILDIILPIIVIGGIAFIIIKAKKNSLFVFSGLLFVLGFFVYSKVIIWILAVILFIVGIALGKNKSGIHIPIKFGKN